MLKLRKADERGYNKIDWLESYHSFSFGGYYDPANMGHGVLRVINDDIIEPDTGFGEHGHRDMEILTYVIEGALSHRDSLGNVASIQAGEVQRMSAGRGIRHSEFNGSKTDKVRLLQIWFLTGEDGIPPSYEQKMFSREDKLNKLCLLVSREGGDKAMKINQDVTIYASILDKDKEVEYKFTDADHFGWIQVALGEIEVNGVKLKNGDGLAIEKEASIKIRSKENGSEFVLFEYIK